MRKQTDRQTDRRMEEQTHWKSRTDRETDRRARRINRKANQREVRHRFPDSKKHMLHDEKECTDDGRRQTDRQTRPDQTRPDPTRQTDRQSTPTFEITTVHVLSQYVNSWWFHLFTIATEPILLHCLHYCGLSVWSASLSAHLRHSEFQTQMNKHKSHTTKGIEMQHHTLMHVCFAVAIASSLEANSRSLTVDYKSP